MQKKNYLCMDLVCANLNKKLVLLVVEIQLCMWLCSSRTAAAYNEQQLPGVGNVTCKFEGVFAFGDSILDTGNNNEISTLARCDFPPNGRDFKDGVATGRCSNGKLLSDLIAEGLGIKELLPAYLDPGLKNKDLLTGVCFASSSAGIDPVLKATGAISLPQQLKMLEEYSEKLTRLVGEERKAAILSNSLFMVSIGTNDMMIAYRALGRKIQYHDDFPSYAAYIVGMASDFFTELYRRGARRIGFLSPGPLGCAPANRGGIFRRECSDEENENTQLYNSMISSELQKLSTVFPDAKFVYLDFYNPIHDLSLDPTKSGFEISKFGCCGTGTVETSLLCNPLTQFSCKDANKYVFWDSIHPGERALTFVAAHIFQNNINSFCV